MLTGTASANVTGFAVDRTTLSWTKASGREAVRPDRQRRVVEIPVNTTGSTRDSADISQATGNYEFRIVYSAGGIDTAMATGTLTAAAPVLSNTATSVVAGLETSSTSFSWTAAAGTPSFQWRPAGTSVWTALTVTTQPNGKPGVDISATSGTYDYRLAATPRAACRRHWAPRPDHDELAGVQPDRDDRGQHQPASSSARRGWSGTSPAER